jgi:hypothetical protein
MAMPEIVFGMPVNTPGSGTLSSIDSFHAGSIYYTGNQENQPFLPIFFIFLYKFMFNGSARDRILNAG